ncbi:MAG: cysteine--tRNA ligase, partial [Methylobacterium sp.]|nr:cysteine--tRNA ligase [Methylobacterium sp.]
MTAQLRLYNTLTRKKEPFTPLDPSCVRMYVCGPTVYDFAHIGNARPVIVFDVLFRLLRHIYGAENVIYTRNITDVDDKINERAVRDYPDLPLNKAIRKVTEGTNAQFQADVKALGCLMPEDVNLPGKREVFFQPRATAHINDMVKVINALLKKDHAYVARGSEGDEILFSVDSMRDYGKLSGRKLEEQQAGARVTVEAHKKNPADFVLWKQSGEREPGWKRKFVPKPRQGYEAEFTMSETNRSELGRNSPQITIFGRPGWHIECSAMSMATLLEPFGGGLSCDDPLKNTFDIHGGGIDLVFPHHENEIAQSCCAFGSERMAQIWMHNGFLQVEGQKMSKSLGNFRTIREVLNDWPGEVVRLAMLKTHYRQPIDWTVANLQSAWSEYLTLRNVSANYFATEPDRQFLEILSDDLNTHEALGRLLELSREAKNGNIKAGGALRAGFEMLGLGKDIPRGSIVLLPPDDPEIIASGLGNRTPDKVFKDWLGIVLKNDPIGRLSALIRQNVWTIDVSQQIAI